MNQNVKARNESYSELFALGCSVCKERNLEEELCFNCKGSGECVNCCGCEEEAGE